MRPNFDPDLNMKPGDSLNKLCCGLHTNARPLSCFQELNFLLHTGRFKGPSKPLGCSLNKTDRRPQSNMSSGPCGCRFNTNTKTFLYISQNLHKSTSDALLGIKPVLINLPASDQQLSRVIMTFRSNGHKFSTTPGVRASGPWILTVQCSTKRASHVGTRIYLLTV